MAENSVAFFEKLQLLKPQINLARSTTARIWLVNLCAFLAVLQSSLSDSFSSFFVALGAVTAAVLTEFLISYKKGNWKVIMDGSSAASALIMTLLLPNSISPLYAAAGAAFAIAVIKHSFGGLGSNWLNPAAGGWLFIRFSWPGAFIGALEGSPLYQMDTFSLFAAPQDDVLRSFLNRTIFSLTGTELPGGYLDLFISRFPGIIADRGMMALIVGTIIITAFRANRSWVPAAYLASFGILVRFAGALPYGGEMWNGDVLFALCSGGTLVAAFFLAGDPITGAKSTRGILLTTLAGGGLAFLFRYFGEEPYGAVIALVCINTFLPLVKSLESRKLYQASSFIFSSGEEKNSKALMERL